MFMYQIIIFTYFITFQISSIFSTTLKVSNSTLPKSKFGNFPSSNSTFQEITTFTAASTSINVRNYQYYKTDCSKCLNFKIQAAKEAYVILSTAPNKKGKYIDVIFGGWDNTFQAIRINNVILVSPSSKSGELDENKYLGFWITWFNNDIKVGKEGVTEPFMTWDDYEQIDIKNFGLAMNSNANGTWIIEKPNCPHIEPCIS